MWTDKHEKAKNCFITLINFNNVYNSVSCKTETENNNNRHYYTYVTFKIQKASNLCGGICILMHVSKALLLLHITNNSFSASMKKSHHHSTPYQYPPLLLHIYLLRFGPRFTVREFILEYNKGKCHRFLHSHTIISI